MILRSPGFKILRIFNTGFKKLWIFLFLSNHYLCFSYKFLMRNKNNQIKQAKTFRGNNLYSNTVIKLYPDQGDKFKIHEI